MSIKKICCSDFGHSNNYPFKKEFCLVFYNAVICAGGADMTKSFWTNQVSARTSLAMKVHIGQAMTGLTFQVVKIL
jgi:hypothetical protein